MLPCLQAQLHNEKAVNTLLSSTPRSKRLATAVGCAVIIASGVMLFLKSDAYCRRDLNCGQLLKLENAVDLYTIETETRPAELSALLKVGPRNWRPPRWLKESDLIDKWGHPIMYVARSASAPSSRLTIRAARGQADGRGPENDIVREW